MKLILIALSGIIAWSIVHATYIPIHHNHHIIPPHVRTMTA